MSQYRKPDGTLTTSPTTDDHVYLGNAQPKFLYGLNSNMTWKNFDFNMFFRGVYGNTILNAQLADLNRPFNASLSNLPSFSLVYIIIALPVVIALIAENVRWRDAEKLAHQGIHFAAAPRADS